MMIEPSVKGWVLNEDDVFVDEGKTYYRLITILKKLGIKRFEYNTVYGQEDDFITHRGVDFISPRMVRWLRDKKEGSENVSIEYSDYLKKWCEI